MAGSQPLPHGHSAHHVRFSICFSGSWVFVPGSSMSSSVTFASLGPAIIPAVEMACKHRQPGKSVSFVPLGTAIKFVID
eukprot:1154903-Pelagomonas_calceolata.AAC.4